jgi:hypothetical protein
MVQPGGCSTGQRVSLIKPKNGSLLVRTLRCNIVELCIKVTDGFCSCMVCLPSIRRIYITLLGCKILKDFINITRMQNQS